jgi:ferric-dicitrate binding protein FerR (iron transport regulator)
VAQLTKASSTAAWRSADDAPRVGALLQAGDTLRLRAGRIMATLVSGASLVLEGPGELRIDGPKALWLQSGRLGVDVPAQATGLVVTSPLARFVDLGTSFTIAMDPAVGCKLQVFAGMVEMTPGSGDAGPVRVSIGSAVSYDAATETVGFLAYDEADRLEL